MEFIDELKREVNQELEHRRSIFKPNWEKYLDFDYIPKNPLHRKEEIKDISIKLIDSITQKTTRNILIYGNPGTGKTMCFKIAMIVAEDYLKKNKGLDNFKIVYVRATGSGVSQTMYDICKNLGINVPKRGISFKEYISYLEEFIGNRDMYIHICIDEFDNLLKDARRGYENLLYYLTRTSGLSCTLITNKINLAKEISDARVLSSLDTLNAIYFKSYTKEQCRDILEDRIELAFRDGFITDEALEVLATHVAEEGGDIRKGLSILRFCGTFAEKKNIYEINRETMQEIIQKHNILKDGEALILTLSLSDKIVLAAIYSLMMENLAEYVDSGDVFAKQDYFRKMLKLPSINRDTLSVYLTRLSTAGVIEIRRVSRGRNKGINSLITLRYPRDAVRYMIHNDPSLSKLRSLIAL